MSNGEGPARDPEVVSGDTAADLSAGGPMLSLLARGLELWLRQQCEAIDELRIELDGNALQLVRGRLNAVRLQARGVRFQSLCFERVELRSSPLQVRMGLLLRNQTLCLENPFEVTGTVHFSAEGLSRSLSTPPWIPLGDALAEEILGVSPLTRLRFEGDRLIFCGQAAYRGRLLEQSVKPLTEDGELVLQLDAVGPDGVPVLVRLPRDANLHFERATVSGGRLELQGRARVST